MNGRTKAVDHSRTRSKLGFLVRALGWPEQTFAKVVSVFLPALGDQFCSPVEGLALVGQAMTSFSAEQSSARLGRTREKYLPVTEIPM